MIRNPFRGVFSPTTSGLLVMGAILSLTAYPTYGVLSRRPMPRHPRRSPRPSRHQHPPMIRRSSRLRSRHSSKKWPRSSSRWPRSNSRTWRQRQR